MVRVPVLDKETEAKPTASVLPPFQGLDVVKTWPQEEGWQPPRLAILPSHYSGGPMDFSKAQLPNIPRQNPQVGLLTERGLLSYSRNSGLEISFSGQTHDRACFVESSGTQSLSRGL